MGRWLLQAFLAYIRPQVIEWTNNMSRDIIRHTPLPTTQVALTWLIQQSPESPHAGSMVPITHS